MESLCSFDGEKVSRFLDAELLPAEMEAMTEHLKVCPVCELRLGQFRQADGLLSRVRTTAARGGRLAASVSVAAALIVSLAANLVLAPARLTDRRAPLSLSAAPSETLASFYERVASPASPGSELRR